MYFRVFKNDNLTNLDKDFPSSEILVCGHLLTCEFNYHRLDIVTMKN